MSSDKTYLNVPYAQKDAAKALGARWDAANKKWFVPAGKDIAAFAQWHTDAELNASSPETRVSPAVKQSAVTNAGQNSVSAGVVTHPTVAGFEAYSGVAPPWD